MPTQGERLFARRPRAGQVSDGSADQSGDPLGAFVGVIETALGQALALTKPPFDL
ncbi:MAG: hypothetical protein ACXVHJ_19015 [Solirubrobacteraceae bacterium]